MISPQLANKHPPGKKITRLIFHHQVTECTLAATPRLIWCQNSFLSSGCLTLTAVDCNGTLFRYAEQPKFNYRLPHLKAQGLPHVRYESRGDFKAQLDRLFIIAGCKKTIVAFGFVVLFKRGRSLVIALSPSNGCWPLKKSDCPLVVPRVFCNVNDGNRIQTGFP